MYKKRKSTVNAAAILVALLALVFPLELHAQAEGAQAEEEDAASEEAADPGELTDIVGFSDPQHDQQLLAALKALATENYNASVDAGIVIKKLATASDLPVLVRELQRLPNAAGRAEIIRTIGDIGDRRASKALRSELEEGKGVSQAAAVRALGRLGSDWAIPSLYELMRKGKETALRIDAASALGELGTPKAIYSLDANRPFYSGGLRVASDWAVAYARGEIDPERIDTKLERGRKLTLYYKGMKYFFYSPSVRKRDFKPWLFVVIHGEELDAAEQFEKWLPVAKQSDVALLVPFFDPLTFSDYYRFNLHGERSDLRLLELIDHVGKYADLLTREVKILGVDLGAGFVQRFAFAYPTRVSKSVVAGEDLLTLDNDVYFPVGIKTSPLAPDIKFELYRVFKSDMMLLGRTSLLRTKNMARELESFYFEIDTASMTGGINHRIVMDYLKGAGPSSTIESRAIDYLYPPPVRPPSIRP